ncbi:putative transcriptional regulatory protein C1327.01c-like protein 2 [Colletotrichum chlorophyti]|uniref:Putative transcriptional regulatory protein C1327.01c-like protein 2 n=1 Tax=Colletotrichum chlorophyti TaxID=708187 RepID=A0A1Q8RR20_9PEZI|nr:putative transcriptional regulatory protein C1327.01c-like protein 2 [Colletotrichum chlorophyti]
MTSTVNGAPPAPKQIRFVHNQGQPPSKRRRINAACLTCRKRKTRCDGERPVCSTCSKNGHACLGYNEVIEKRTSGGVIATRTPHHDVDDDDYDNDNDNDNDNDDGGHEDGRARDDQYNVDEKRHWKIQGKSRRLSAPEVEGAAATSNGSEATAARSPTFVRRSSETTSRDQTHPTRHRRPSHPRTTSFSDDAHSTHSRSPVLHHAERHRVPYFRYFGPTAIVPGYKKMVVSVRDRRRSTGGSACATSPSSGSSVIHSLGMAMSGLPQHEEEAAVDEDLPIYDPNDPAPVPHLILHLVKTFFTHLGCNYPFLKEEKFVRMVKEKHVEPILVDAVCALAARFSDSSQISHNKDDEASHADQGQYYAQRAKASTVDTFPCPSVGAVQALLMMAYEGFGADQDSALWMYLGLAIRMAVDLGLQKMVGVKHQGERDPWYTRTGSDGGADEETPEDESHLSREEQLEVEQERTDTFWAVFILDRVISSGTGRPVTFRDDDFELSLPEPTLDPGSGWPAPFPIFIQIIHLYGRVSDVLNNIRNARDLTQDKWTKLRRMEHELTKLYQKQDQRLHFSVANFKTYLKAGQGTNFILLHFWFHALIIILHQPTLLTPFGSLSRTHQLLPNSRELSMSSAKTIADILAFAELIDPKSFIGNPFTSQPMYIAACAFLMESIANASNPASRETSPPMVDSKIEGLKQKSSASEQKPSTKHSLLASAANQNYSRCYKSLQQLHKYWGGVKYILTALDQKSKGIWDCETYTTEEYESTKLPRRGSIGVRFPHPTSPNAPPIAWSLTGMSDSPNPSLTLMYRNMPAGAPGHHEYAQQHQPSVPASAPTPPGNMIYDPIRQSLPEAASHSFFAPTYPQAVTSAMRHSSRPSRPQRPSTSSMGSTHGHDKRHMGFDGIVAEEPSPPGGNAGSMLAAPSAQQQSTSFTPTSQHSSNYEQPMISPTGNLSDAGSQQHHNGQHVLFDPTYANATYSYLGQGMGPITDVITFDNPIDIGALGLPNEMMQPWLEYLPGDVLSLFENNGMDPGS